MRALVVLGERRTVGRHLVTLDAMAAGQTGDTGLLVDLGGDGIFCITKDTLEFGGEPFALSSCELDVLLFGVYILSHTFLGPCGLDELLRLPCEM